MILSTVAQAHRGHDMSTVVTIATDGTVTVSHRFQAHDLEPALVRIAPEAQPSLDDPAAIEGLRRYVRAGFLMAQKGRPIALSPQEMDLQGDEVRIDLKGKLSMPPDGLVVASSLLADVYPKQVNQILVRYGKLARTIIARDDEPQAVILR